MTKPITAAEALRLAREALEDDNRMTPWTGQPTREPQLARFVEAVLGARETSRYRVNAGEGDGAGIVYVAEHTPKMDGSDVIMRLRPDKARALAAALLRAADEAEAKR